MDRTLKIAFLLLHFLTLAFHLKVSNKQCKLGQLRNNVSEIVEIAHAILSQKDVFSTKCFSQAKKFFKQLNGTRTAYHGQAHITGKNEIASTIFHDCSQIFDSGLTCSGIYPIWAKELFRTIFVYCDMDTVNTITKKRGWTVIQRRLNGEINFERGWDDYVKGFGSLAGEYWIGLENIYRLTRQHERFIEGRKQVKYPQMRIDLEDWDGIRAFVEHERYMIHPKDRNYEIYSISPYHGPAVPDAQPSPINYVPFSTFDADHEEYEEENVAQEYRSGWWFRLFPIGSLNGPYPKSRQPMSRYNIRWKFWFLINSNNTALRVVVLTLLKTPYPQRVVYNVTMPPFATVCQRC